MKPIALASFAALSLLFLSCGRHSENTGAFITAPGEFEMFGGETKVTVTQATNGAISYRIACGPCVAGSPRPQFRAGQPWFIFPQTPTNTWIFDGRTNLTEISFKDGAARTSTSQREPDLWKRIPPAARQRLPAELQAK